MGVSGYTIRECINKHLMKTIRTLLSVVLGLMSCYTASAQSYTDLDVSNQATIGAAIHLGSVQIGANASAGTSYGQRMEVTQQAQEVMQSYTIPGYNQDNWVTVEDWGWVDVPGYWSPQYTWGIVGEDYYPAVYDENGVEIAAAYWVPRYGDVYTGDTWVSGYSTWGITGTHEENQSIWIPDQVSSYWEMNYSAPVIHATASRSDANWVWNVPDTNGNLHHVLRLWDGGLTLPLPNGEVSMTLSPTSLSYSGESGGPQHKSAQMNAEGTFHTTTVTGAASSAQSASELRPELIRLTRTETTNGATTLGQTQIAAKSAAFGGVVEVAGDLKVQGTLRVPEQGDLSMGEFTSGPQP